jgi:hypothetical protein
MYLVNTEKEKRAGLDEGGWDVKISNELRQY